MAVACVNLSGRGARPLMTSMIDVEHAKKLGSGAAEDAVCAPAATRHRWHVSMATTTEVGRFGKQETLVTDENLDASAPHS